MNDLISRQDALNEIHRVYEYEFPTASGAFDEFVTIIIPNILRNLPSAYQQSDAEVKTAKVEHQVTCWEDISPYKKGMCASCGRNVYDHAKYCDECGVKLEW